MTSPHDSPTELSVCSYCVTRSSVFMAQPSAAAADSWAMNIDRGFVNAVVFQDSKKAFDAVDHNIPLTTLQFYGIRGFCHKWSTSYFSNRTQTCLINPFMCTPKLVKCGVPQGTILGPLVYLLYINDLPNCLYFSQPRIYAKDTSLTFASVDLKHTNDCFDNELNRVYTWLSASKLTVNLTKTEFMLVASRKKLSTFPEIPSFIINDHPVKQVSSTKSRGVQID